MASAPFYDRVMETSTTTGTGTLTLAGAVTGYQTFGAIGNANTTPMAIWAVDANGNPSGAWEVANVCTYTTSGTTLTRGTFLASSTGSAVSFAAGTKRVAQALPAAILNGLSYASQTGIAGLELSWVSATAIDILIGSAYVQSVERVVQVTSTISLTSISLGNSAWGYIYLLNDGTAEVNTTAPAAAYAGTARSKTADTSRRFLGAVRTDASGNIFRFRHFTHTSFFRYSGLNIGAAPHRILSNGASQTSASVDGSAVVPPQSRMAYVKLQNLNLTNAIYYGNNDYTVSATVFDSVVGGNTAGATFSAEFIGCTSGQVFNYIVAGAGGGAYMDVEGYLLAR